MHNPSELLIRSAVHDLANVLAGVRGIIDLSSPDRPLSPRDRDRLEAVLDEGMATLDRTRRLATGALPDAALMPGVEWRGQLLEQLHPMGVIFRCRFEVLCDGDPQWDRWPGELLQGYVRAVTRQVLPHVQDGVLTLHCACDGQAWLVRWRTASSIPDNLLPASDGSPQDIGSRWAAKVGGSLGIALSCEDGALAARIPRP